MRSLPMLGPRAQWQRYASVLYLTTGIHSLFDNKHSSSQAVFCAGWERSSTTQVRGNLVNLVIVRRRDSCSQQDFRGAHFGAAVTTSSTN